MIRVIVLVGASGSGKTTVAEVLARRPPWTGNTYSFDTIGVPSASEMEERHGGAEAWQLWATQQWMERLSRSESALQLLEGQTRPSFVMTAAEPYPELVPEVILLDCTPEVRRHRLAELRGSSGLADPQMDCWAAYLTGQAHALGLPVIDTSDLELESVADQVEAAIRVA